MTVKNDFDKELRDDINEASKIHKMWFEVFGFVSDNARRNFIVTVFVFLLLWASITTIFLIRSERKCSESERRLIEKYETKIDAITERLIKLSEK